MSCFTFYLSSFFGRASLALLCGLLVPGLFFLLAPGALAFPEIKNPSFEKDEPGPLPIIGILPSDWIVVGDAGTNPTMEFRGADGALLIDPYIVADNGLIPDGDSIFWLQNIEAETGELGDVPVSEDELYAHVAQEISGFEPGKTYVLVYWENVRANWGYRPLRVWAKLGSATIDPAHQVSPVEGFGSRGRPYSRRISSEITPSTSGPLRLAVYMTTQGRPSATITPGVNYPAEVQGKRRAAGNLILDYFKFVELGNLKLSKARRSVVNPDKITCTFSADISESSLTNLINYAVLGGPAITQARRLANNRVELTVASPLEDGSSYQLRVQGIVGTNSLGMFATNSVQPIDLAAILPAEFGQSLTCFQDDFNGTILSSAWAHVGSKPTLFQPYYGILKIKGVVSGSSDLLCQIPGYEPSAQEILMKVRFMTLDSNVRLGPVTTVDAISGNGLNFSVENTGTRYETGFEDEGRSQPPAIPYDLRPGAWYWMRLTHSPGAIAGSNDALGRIWLADGDTPEPDGATFKYPVNSTARQGLAGLAVSGSGGNINAEIDYILIKAEGSGFQRNTVELPRPIENPVILSIEHGNDQVQLTWPLDFPEFTLYYNDSVDQPYSWMMIDPQLVISDFEMGRYIFTESASSTRFYRLMR